MTLEVGDKAPDFTLKDQHGAPITLSDFRGSKNVVVVFYPFAFTGVCTGELCAIRDDLGAFVNDDVQILSVSVDSVFSHRVFAEQQNLEYPMLSDFWPHGETAQAYGVFDENLGAAVRGTFIIDKDGIVRWKVVNAIPDARDQQEYKAVLDSLA
jgi:mycoredoxin-dependent peroxiredoxin